MNPLTQLKKTTALLVIPLAFVCFALVQNTQAVVPAPDGGYPGGNTAEGQAALLTLSTGGFNTAVGWLSLRSNTTGSFNTAFGAGALLANVGDPSSGAGTENTATGAGALLSNTTGSFDTANGAFALFSNTTGFQNTAIGATALKSNTIGEFNTAIGTSALLFNTGYENTATGAEALVSNTTGNNNTAIGATALGSNVTGSDNVALGFAASFNVTTATNVICIGFAVGGENVSNSCFIGNIYNTPTVSGTTLPVIVSDQGQLGTTPSSRRFKHEIKPMNNASESILALKPVTFHYKGDTKDAPQFGLIAEEVAEVNPDLVVRDNNGEIYTVRYDAVNAMLLNEFLKEHHQVQDLKAIVAGQQKQIEALTAGLQKVSAQLEASKPAPQVVNNP